MITYGVKAKIAYHNLVSRLRVGEGRHVSGYVGGNSPDTDVLAAVDARGNICGQVKRDYAHAHGVLHATVHLLLFNSKSKLLVQMRSPYKDSSPGKLSQSVGGHVSLGISPEETLKKETYEELGIDKLSHSELITTYPYSSNSGRNEELVYLFRGIHDGPVYPNYSEVAWAAFFGLNGIRALADQESSRFAPSFQQDLRHFPHTR